MPDARHKAQLEARAAELTARLNRIDAELDEPAPKDWEDLAIEREGDEVLETMGAAGQQELRQIAAALERIAEGTYGVCVACGGEISDERLDLVPYTPFCADCAT